MIDKKGVHRFLLGYTPNRGLIVLIISGGRANENVCRVASNFRDSFFLPQICSELWSEESRSNEVKDAEISAQG